MAKVSIIVPVYNVEKYIEKCLKSLLKQTFKDIEIWVINDGTPDNSQKIIDKYVKKDNRIVSVIKDNGGYGSVLEYAIKNIKTKYFLICDPDDWLEQNAVDTLYKCAEKNNSDIVYGCYNLAYNDSNDFQFKNGTIDEKIFCPIDNKTYDKNLDAFSMMTPSPHAKLYKTKITKKIKFPKKVSYTDFLLYIVSLNNSTRITYLKMPLAYYLVDRPGNTATDINPRVFSYHQIVFCSILEQINLKDKPLHFYRLLNYAKEIMYTLKNANISTKREKVDNIYTMFEALYKYKNMIFQCKYLTNKEKVYSFLLLSKLTSKKYINRALYK